METLRLVLLVLHAVSGAVALLTGILQMVRKKGGTTHRRTGTRYVQSMAVVCFSGLALAILRPSLFLGFIAVFSGFLTYSGWHSLARKGSQPGVIAWVLSGLGLLNGLAMMSTLNTVLLVFGLGSLVLAGRDLVLLYRWQTAGRPAYAVLLGRHISMITGAFISTATAFLVVNLDNFSPAWLPWLLPSALIVPFIPRWIRRYNLKVAATVVLGMMTLSTSAQPYADGNKTRHRFAQMYIGALGQLLPESTSGFSPKSTTAASGDLRLLIGGLHFWGHADFYLSLPVVRFNKEGFLPGVETGFNYYPWAVETNKLRPYLGVAWLPSAYRLGNGAEKQVHHFPLQAGVTYCRGHHLLQAGVSYLGTKEVGYYLSPAEPVRVGPSPWAFSLAYKFWFDSTLSAEESWKSGRAQAVAEKLGGKLNGLTLAVGVSSSFFLMESPALDEESPWFHRPGMTRVFPELGLGYYFHQPDLLTNLSWRRTGLKLTSGEERLSLSRQTITLEAAKFLTDYHGFAFFAGPAVAWHSLNFARTGPVSGNEELRSEQVGAGLLLGWDIRPNRIQSWYLRTNLRWFLPMEVVTENGKTFRFDQLEVNFIQLVIFPERFF